MNQIIETIIKKYDDWYKNEKGVIFTYILEEEYKHNKFEIERQLKQNGYNAKTAGTGAIFIYRT